MIHMVDGCVFSNLQQINSSRYCLGFDAYQTVRRQCPVDRFDSIFSLKQLLNFKILIIVMAISKKTENGINVFKSHQSL